MTGWMIRESARRGKRSIFFVHAPRSPEDFMEIAKAKNYQVGWVAYNALEYATSYEDCLHIAQVCGYQKGWAWHKWQERRAKLLSGRI